MRIDITSTYGFDHNWTLVVNDKSFYLGQDVKFCSRVLGMEPRDVVLAIGTGEIGEGTKGNKALAKFIYKTLGLNAKTLNKLNNWELCAQ